MFTTLISSWAIRACILVAIVAAGFGAGFMRGDKHGWSKALAWAQP